MSPLRPFTPAAKARWLLDTQGTPAQARHVATTHRQQHEPGSESWTYWNDVLATLAPRAVGGKPHTRAQRRKLREARK